LWNRLEYVFDFTHQILKNWRKANIEKER